jgi:ribosomal protein S18 acetylase RimI-like enzyme
MSEEATTDANAARLASHDASRASAPSDGARFGEDDADMTDSGPTLTVRPMRQDEFPAFLEASKRAYAEGIATQGGQTPEFAAQKSEADHVAILPNGLDTPEHAILVVEADGERVGILWIAARESGGRRVCFIYDIEIDEAYRGRGYGRAAMLLAEEEARQRGLGRVELNVFGGNDVARGLYRSLGYVETSVQMAKDLA